jgi:tetratricopeptide (TPR) repeat protein
MRAKRSAGLLCLTLLSATCSRDPHDVARRAAARGDEFTKEGRPDAALIEYRNAVRAWPTWNEAHEKLGNALAQVGRTGDAYRAYAVGSQVVDGETLPQTEEELRALLAGRPKLAAAHTALAGLLLSRQAADEAEEHLLAAVAAEPSNELANRSLAALYLSSGRKELVEDRLKMAASAEPQRYRSQIALADFLRSERRLPEARTVLESSAGDERLDSAIALRLAAMDYEEGAVDRAHRALTDLLAAAPTAEAWTLEAEFRFREGKLADALEAARQALALDPELAAAQHLTDNIRRQQLTASAESRRKIR